MASWLSRIAGTLADAFRIGRGTVDAAGLTAARTHELQDQDGVLAHLSDIPAVLDYLDPTTTTTEELIDALIASGWMDGPTPAVPVNTVSPTVTGGPSIGSVLSCGNGTWTNSPTSYAYQWEADTGTGYADIVGETASTLDTTGMSNGDLVRCKVVATNGAGDSLPATSNAITLSSGILRIFGYDPGSTPSDGSPNSDGRAWAAKYTKSHAGTVTAIKAYFGADSTTGNYKICAHAAGGIAPGAPLWSTPTAVVPNGGGLVEFDLPTSGLDGTDAAADYWLIAVSDGSGFPSLGGSTGSSIGVNSVRGEGYDYASAPVSWPGSADSYNVKYDIFCEYIG